MTSRRDDTQWIQIVRGAMQVNGAGLVAGDGVALSEEKDVQISGKGEALLFDLN